MTYLAWYRRKRLYSDKIIVNLIVHLGAHVPVRVLTNVCFIRTYIFVGILALNRWIMSSLLRLTKTELVVVHRIGPLVGITKTLRFVFKVPESAGAKSFMSMVDL